MGVKINRIELNGKSERPSLAVFMFVGNEDPVKVLDDVVKKYVGENGYFEFIDANMDNPYTRVILKEIEKFPKTRMNVEGRVFEISKLHISNNVEVLYLSYLTGPDVRPYPIMDLALAQLSNYRMHNTYIDSDISDLWSRLVIFNVNNIPQEEFKNQKI